MAACLALPSLAGAGDSPPLISFEGRLLRADGTPERGVVTMHFSLYANPTSGTAAWNEQQAVRLSADGYYAVQLGASAALPAFDGGNWWLGVALPDEPEMTPRARLVSVPYALRATSAARADDAARLGGDAATEFLRYTSPLPASRLAGQLTGAVTNVPLLGVDSRILSSYMPQILVARSAAAPEACADGNRGAIYYDLTLGTFVGCYPDGWRPVDTSAPVARTCRALKLANLALTDGVYTIDPDGPQGNEPFQVYCDMTTDGGGWTLLETIGSAFGNDAAYWSPTARFPESLLSFATAPNATARASPERINAICRAGEGYVRHRYANNAPGYMLTDHFAASLRGNLDYAYMLRGDASYMQGMRAFGNGTETVTFSGNWRRYNSYLTDNYICTGIHGSCGGNGAGMTLHGVLCDSYGCNKPGQRVVDGHMWMTYLAGSAVGAPSATYAAYGNYGSRWCR